MCTHALDIVASSTCALSAFFRRVMCLFTHPVAPASVDTQESVVLGALRVVLGVLGIILGVLRHALTSLNRRSASY